MCIRRRDFLAGMSGAAMAGAFSGKARAAVPERSRLFRRQQIAIQAFAPGAVKLLDGPLLAAQEANRAVLHRLPVDRLVYNFRSNARISSPTQPLGGWEKPDCELRGHFTGHYLSACALMYAYTGDEAVKAKGDEIVAELAKCQASLTGGYLSAFPLEYFDRLERLEQVWAPFYTIHKIMAGLLDMYTLASNQQAMKVLTGMADWADTWTSQFPREHMQEILRTEYGGMGETLYSLYAITSDARYLRAGDNFAKDSFYSPLALRQDQLKGLHVNTHIPQVIAAARRYELTGDPRFRQISQFFYETVTESRAYVTGGTSNNESWLVDPGQLSAEWQQATDTAECCCMYNMLKLTRTLYSWSGDPRYFDYYERVLMNHRLGTIDLKTGDTMYYLSHTPGAWKTFCSEYDSFWCCTGTGVEEYSKLAGNIYAQDAQGPIVNLFAASELNWREKGLTLRQQTSFPHSGQVTLSISAAAPVQTALRLRIPVWVSGASASVNSQPIAASASPGGYLVLDREWKTGDSVTLSLPMHLRTESMPDKASIQAVMYGPLVLAAITDGPAPEEKEVFGPMGPKLKEHGPAPEVKGSLDDRAASWVEQAGPLAFTTRKQEKAVSLKPLNEIQQERYSIYWRVADKG